MVVLLVVYNFKLKTIEERIIFNDALFYLNQCGNHFNSAM